MVDMISLGLGAASIMAVPLGAVLKKAYALDRRLTILETNHENINAKLTSVENKLDRLIDKFL